ncbi:MAG: hypothetical protein J6M27_03420 [Lachnospiraceae bacterium]|nr:hypothetical protein [Lachnospiraceae bacterium]
MMEKQVISINGEKVYLPDYFHKVASMSGDPENSIPYEVYTENAGCLAFISPVDYSKSLPREREELIRGIRSFLSDNQGIIEVTAENNYVYSIVKNLKEPSGVQYILTYQRFCKDFIVNVQAFFEEMGTTGIRDNVVYMMCQNEKMVGNDQDPFAGWVRDPYDESISTGALMNISEQERFDELFPGFPLTMCREFIRCIVKGEGK